MKVIVDNKIPFIKEAIECIADEVVYAAGKDFTPALIKDADALIIRTRTQCNQELLENSKVSFIATATIGFDHIDLDYCQKAGISWASAPGCNASSVAQYLQSALLLLQQTKSFDLKDLTLGVVGVGNVGSKIVELGHRMGMRVLSCDAPRADREGKALFCALETIAEQCDIISFHVPLIKEGKYMTYHLADENFLNSLKKSPILINTSRGEVVHTNALLQALNNGKVADAVIDVWENEPAINLPLLNKVFLGTPHIAGYSADGKSNATRMALDALCRHFHLQATYRIQPPEPVNQHIIAATPAEAALAMYDPRQDSEALKSHPDRFEQIRGDYPLRRESNAYTLPPLPFPLF